MVLMPGTPPAALVVKAHSDCKSILKQRPVSTYKPECGKQSQLSRVSSAPASRTSSRQSQQRCASAKPTQGDNSNPSRNQLHWLAWDTGNLEPPGLQKRCHRPWPSPEPPLNIRPVSAVATKRESNTPPSIPRAASARTPSARNQQQGTCGGSGAPCAVKPNANAVAGGVNYAPHFRSWHTSGCDDYEADVTYNMLQHLYGGKARQLDKMRRNRPGRYEHPINFERRIINETYKGLEAMDVGGGSGHYNPPASSGSGKKVAIDYYPVSYHRESARSAPYGGRTDMTISSHFQFTQPSVRGTFVIHPDFVSEHTEFSKNLRHVKSATGNASFRYGSRAGR